MGRPDPSCPPPQTHIITKSIARDQNALISGVWVWFGLVLILKHMGSPVNISQIIPIMSLIKLLEISRRPLVEVTS